MDLTLDPRIQARDGVRIIEVAFKRPVTRPVALAWLAENYDALAARVPREQQSYFAAWAGRICGSDERAQFVALFATRVANLDAGARTYRQTLETIDACIAMRRVQEPALNAFLATAR